MIFHRSNLFISDKNIDLNKDFYFLGDEEYFFMIFLDSMTISINSYYNKIKTNLLNKVYDLNNYKDSLKEIWQTLLEYQLLKFILVITKLN
jgi:hypothetical protein